MYLEEDGMEMREDVPRDCFYSGTVKGHSNSRVSVNTCGGMTGTISREGYEDVYIEPLHHAHAQKRGMDSALGHVIYKAPKEIHNMECGVHDNEDHTMRQMRDIDLQNIVPTQKYLKLHIVADHHYWANKGAESCKCITATFQALAHRMAMLPGLNVLLSRITIIKTNTILNTTSDSSNNLWLVREWKNTQPDEAQWDHVALVVPMHMDVAGRAYSCSVCGGNKCSVSYIGSLFGVQVLAHEIGHK
ncbi:zinc metalloproteinase/disintegrin-like [Amphiura filiformis]|uniref:zinc metalloproteinase/disintegrin-like n=1 Tax=Amphiura filiformis TaxID=82378 RepID=UPI003B223CA6